MMGNFFNSMYYGKNKSDYTPDNMPKNRLELFLETLRVRLFKLMQLNLIYLLFAIPFLFNIFLHYSVLMAGAETTGVTSIFSVLIQFFMMNIPCMVILGLGQVGMTYVTRNWARDDHSWVWSDFIDSIKQNWKQGLLAGLFKGVAFFLAVVAAVYYNQMAQQSLVFFVLFWVILMLMLVMSMVDLFIWPTIVTYELKLRHALRNSLVLGLARLPWTVLFLFLQALPFVLFLAFSLFLPEATGIVTLVFVLFYLVIGFALTSFVNVSYANATFDRFINPRIEGAAVNKGLRVEDEDEYEYEDDPKAK